MAHRMLWAPLALFATLAPLVSADIQFTSPAAGTTLTGGSALVIEWKDSGESPALADLTTYELFLFAGGNEDAEMVSNRLLRIGSQSSLEYLANGSSKMQLLPITQAAAAFTVTGNKATVAIGTNIGASSPKNA